ncbi:21580_t:CDS:2, partial [Racocetra persica]
AIMKNQCEIQKTHYNYSSSVRSGYLYILYYISGTPYSCQHSVSPSASLPEEMFTQLSELIEEYQNYDQNEDDVSRLDKMLESLSSHISVPSSAAESFISRVRELMNANFRPDKKSNAECHDNTDSIIKKGQE